MQDDTSLYGEVRAIWENASGVSRALLTFVNAGHNAGAPYPAPTESYDREKGFNISEHHSDPVWNTARMNNISQHFVTAWLDMHLKGKAEKAEYLDLVADSNAGVWSMEEDGTGRRITATRGSRRTAKGLMYGP